MANMLLAGFFLNVMLDEIRYEEYGRAAAYGVVFAINLAFGILLYKRK